MGKRVRHAKVATNSLRDLDAESGLDITRPDAAKGSEVGDYHPDGP